MATPYFATQTAEDWQDLLTPPASGMSLIRPMLPHEWTDYMTQYNANCGTYEPYPDTQFLTPELYVWPPVSTSPDDAGLVMYWGDSTIADGNYASAWVYEYGLDPDLSASILKIEVEAPCGMQQISVGLVDAAGFIRAWYWNVAPAGQPSSPGVLKCSPGPANPVRHTIKIDLSQVGTTAATPTAFSYSSALGFSIANVQNITFDENFQWLPPSVPVPPPGQTDPKPWNYWFNLSVYPKGVTANKGVYVKWSRPPVELEPGLIRGWDERSVEPGGIMADDWECWDDRPVTDIHWWGSFIGWTERRLPPVVPIAFRIGIWTDEPSSVTNPFSHPKKLVWTNYCTSFTWNFAGYDIDPRPQPMYDEACFQFNQYLSEDEWFYQEPRADGLPNIYWLSISAVYPAGTEIQYPWGWKTRPEHVIDDAVRINDTNGQWPPMTIGDEYTGGDELLLGEESWDLAFELTTNKPAYCDNPILGDFNCDKIVNFIDFAFFANNWLVTAP